MKSDRVFVAGAAYGLLMRLIFGFGDISHVSSSHAAGPMLASFVFVVPLTIGILTVYLSKQSTRTVWRSIWTPCVPVLAFVVGSAALLFEGSICIAIALPIFLLSGSLGGLLAYVVLKITTPSPAAALSVAAFPLLLGFVEHKATLPQDHLQTAATIHIEAPPEAVWYYINNALEIRRDEMPRAIAYNIGVPYPIEARTIGEGAGRVRKLRWEKGVEFDEEITDWEVNRFIRWEYRFTEYSFPKNSLDDHVRIGGSYFDLIDTSYRLEPESGGTRLDIHVTYRVSTNFNWYAKWWARTLIDNTAGVILQFYKNRSEANDTPPALSAVM